MMQIRPTASRRNVTLDIETVSLDPSDDKGALSALSARIVCLGLLIDDGIEIRELALIDEDESVILRKFWQEVKPTDLLIGHNIWGFDLPTASQSRRHSQRP
jgi:uncharacterized protein YprB with RNaseH-like and TPR domain